MKARTRALARRQLTWMRKLPAAALVPTAGRPPEAVAEERPDPPRGTPVVEYALEPRATAAVPSHRGSCG